MLSNLSLSPIQLGMGVAVISILIIAIYWKRNQSSKSDTNNRKKRPTAESKNKPRTKSTFSENTVALTDLEYLASHLTPTSTPFEILFYLATTPEAILATEQVLENVQKIRAERIEYLNPTSKQAIADREKRKAKENESASMAFDIGDDDGWADGDDDDNDEKESKKVQREKEELAKQVAVASGKVNIIENMRLEGIDDGVVGQKWVEKELASIGQWPPPFLNNKMKQMTFAQNDDSESLVGPMEHEAIRRNLCMTMGRLNSHKLNENTTLVESAAKNLIDQSYFKETMAFRQRTALLLEAAMRLAGSLRSYRLYKTIVETGVMFQIGIKSITDPNNIDWYNNLMTKTYGPTGIPKVAVTDPRIETQDEKEIATGDISTLFMTVERLHTEAFTKQKVNAAIQQGLPPQVALNSFHEGWWIMIRAVKIDDNQQPVNDEDATLKEENPILKNVGADVISLFNAEKGEDRLVAVLPFIVKNVAQLKGNVKVRFPVPNVPGKYKVFTDILSQEYIGANHSFTLECEIVDKKDVVRTPKESESEESKDTEPKKDK